MNEESNVLVLDEPTNHLDVDARGLKRALQDIKYINGVSRRPEFEGLATDVGIFKILKVIILHFGKKVDTTAFKTALELF